MGKCVKDMTKAEIKQRNERVHKWYVKNKKNILKRRKENYHYTRLPFDRVDATLNRKIRRMMQGFGKEGICLICGELDPRFLVQHHIFGKESKLTVTLCANCHRKYMMHPKENHYTYILRAIELHILD